MRLQPMDNYSSNPSQAPEAMPPPSEEASPFAAPAAPAGPPAEGAAPPPGPAAPADPAVASAAKSTTLNPRLAPQDLAAERSILGGIMLTNDALWDIVESVKPEDLYREQHRKIYQAMIDLANRKEPIDVITLANELRKKQDLEAAGGIAYLASLDASVPATGRLQTYANIVRDKALARRLIETAHNIARDGYEQKGDVADLLDAAEQKIFDVTNQKALGALQPLGDSVKRVYDNLEKLYENQNDITGLATGLSKLDQMTSGLQKGELIIVAGRPSMGKTSLVMNMAAHAALPDPRRQLPDGRQWEGRPVAVFSLEMTADQLTMRMVSAEARVDSQRLRTGRLLDSDWPKLARATEKLYRGKMFVDDSAGLSALDMRAKCRRLKAQQKDLALVVVDYLQLMKGRADADSREQEISEISRSLKALAKEMEVPVIALSQLNRSLERREDKRPQLSDLRESGAIEQDADVICFIYRDEVYNKESQDKGVAEIIIGKQRNGPTGTARVAFLNSYTLFENLADDREYGGGGGE